MSAPGYLFIVPGDPKGQPRARAFTRKVGNAFVARVFEAGTAEGWKSAIAVAAAEIGLRDKMLEGPISFSMRCFFKRPRSHFRTGKNHFFLKPGAPKWHTSKPDRDNLEKAAKDALTQIGVWRDDCQVCTGMPTKRYVVSTQNSYTEFEIIPIGEQPSESLV